MYLGITVWYLGITVWYLGITVWYLGTTVWHLGIIVWHLGIIVWHLGIIVWYLGIIVWYLGITVWYLGITVWQHFMASLYLIGLSLFLLLDSFTNVKPTCKTTDSFAGGFNPIRYVFFTKLAQASACVSFV